MFMKVLVANKAYRLWAFVLNIYSRKTEISISRFFNLIAKNIKSHMN